MKRELKGERKMAFSFTNNWANAKETGYDNQLPVGSHLVAIRSVLGKESRGGKRGNYAEFRYVVVQTNNPDVRIGDTYSEVFFPDDPMAGDNLETNRGRLRAVVRVIAGLPASATPDEVNDALMEMISDAQPAKGIKVSCTGAARIAKKTQREYVALRYDSVAQTAEDIVATRTWIDGQADTAPAQATSRQTELPITQPSAPTAGGFLARMKGGSV